MSAGGRALLDGCPNSEGDTREPSKKPGIAEVKNVAKKTSRLGPHPWLCESTKRSGCTLPLRFHAPPNREMVGDTGFEPVTSSV